MKFRRLVSAVLAVVMVGISIFNGILPVMADTSDSTVQNSGPVELGDGVILSKTAKSVPGYANKWEVTLRIESPKTKKTSDTVIVIDRSGSMGDDDRLANAKTAAGTLVRQLLPSGNTTNRVGVVSFASNSEIDTDFTYSYDTVSAAIDRMKANGGTYTQSAIHMAAEMLKGSTADIKTMILLSDGEPTYSVPFTKSAIGNDDNFVAYGNALETSSGVEQSVFDYSGNGRVGNGGNLRDCIEKDWWGNCLNYYKYYNNGNSAIAEAGYYKAKGGTIYTIALDADEVGTPILNAIASSGKDYTATPAELNRIFSDIGGDILSLIQSASVKDTMGQGVVVSDTGNTSIEWTPKFQLEGDVFVAEKSYEVEMNESVYEQVSADGFYPLNDSAVLTYNGGKTGEFPVPKAKPFAVNVEKELVVVDKSGNATTKNGEEFKFKISGNGKEKEYSVKSGDGNVIKVPMPIKIGTEYIITETGAANESERKFENYNIEYTGNRFVVTQNHGDKINAKIKNIYEETEVSVNKVWDDDNDRDGLRKNYSDLSVAVKDGNKYVAYEALDLTRNKNYTFGALPKNRNGVAIDYEIVEAKGCNKSGKTITCASEFTGDVDNEGNAIYIVTNGNGVITNKHVPEMTELTIKKKWDISAGTLPTVTPGFVTVEVSNNKNSTVKTVTLQGETYNEWTGKFEGYKYEAGQEITYTVKEKGIDNGFLNSKNTLYVYKDNILEGKWAATYNGAEVTNTWTPAKTLYTGTGEFYIEKTDQDGKALSDVTFTVGDKTFKTGSDGSVRVEFSKATEKAEDKYIFKITETDAPEYYDVIEGTEVLEATTDMKLTVDEANLTNTYAKSFTFAVKTAIDGYVWQGNGATLLVTDQALADELKIEKTFEGISAEAFERNSQIKFTISGPDGFVGMTVGNGDKECTVSGNKLTCIIDGSEVLLPVGKYTVTEGDAEIENFTYTSEPGSKKIEKTAELGEVAEFKFKNVYEPVKTASFEVEKIWDDDGNRDGVRPESVKIKLVADGKVVDTVKLNEENGWKYSWTKLDVANEDAEVIKYSAMEEEVDGYVTSEEEIDNGKVFTNTHKPELIKDDDDDLENDGKLEVIKEWNDNGDALKTRPLNIVVRLYADGEEIASKSVMSGKDGEWKCVFEGLYKNKNGKEIEYTVKEDEVMGYSAKYVSSGYDYMITNDSTDPCVFGGCGRVSEPVMKVKAPETGEVTKAEGGVSASLSVAAAMVMAMVALAGAAVFAKRK